MEAICRSEIPNMAPLAAISVIMKALFLNTKGVLALLLTQSRFVIQRLSICINGLSQSVDPSFAVFLPFPLSFAFQPQGGPGTQEVLRPRPKNFSTSLLLWGESDAAQKLKDISGWLVQGY